MKKILLLSSLLASSLLMASEPIDAQLQADIDAAKKVKSEADAKLKALEAKLPQNQDIMTNLQVGYVKTDGNTDTETFSLDGKLKKEWGSNALSLILDAQYGNADKIIIKNKFFVELEYATKMTDTLSATVLLGYKNDQFSSFDYQSYVGVGLKHKTYKSEKQELNLEASLLYSHDEIQPQFAILGEDFEKDYGSYKTKLTYELQLLDNLKFNQELSYRSSFVKSDNYFIYSNSQLKSKLSDIFSAGISYKIDYANTVATGIEQRDNTLSAFISLDY